MDHPGTKVLLTGATGYIGRRLTDRLLCRPGVDLRLFVRNKDKIRPSIRGQIRVGEGDFFDQESLFQSLEGIDVAYYLLGGTRPGRDPEERTRLAAGMFQEACLRSGVKRIVYLGRLAEKEPVGRILGRRPDRLQTIGFRSAMIIGSGSACFEIIRNLVQKLPFLVALKWMQTRTRPIAVDDVLSYLTQALDTPIQGNHIMDIGERPMSFRDMLDEAARVMGLKRLLIPVPVFCPRLSSFWLTQFTPVPYPLARTIIEGLRSETLPRSNQAAAFFPDIRPKPFSQAVSSALEELEKDEVVSRWCDSSGDEACDIKGQADTETALFRDRREFFLGSLSREAVFRSLTSIGGETGWVAYNTLWQLRGLLDKLVGGYGLNRGRRVLARLRPGDALDFWKVVDIRENKRLLLLAQMKVPGKAWLEFDLQKDRLVQTAHFLPRGLLGRLYWYAVLPFHALVFGGLGRKILERAARLEKEGEGG